MNAQCVSIPEKKYFPANKSEKISKTRESCINPQLG